MSLAHLLASKLRIGLIWVVNIVFLVGLVNSATAQDTTNDSSIIQATTTLFGTDIRPIEITSTFASTNVAPWYNAGYRGRGIRVGIIDAGFEGLDDFESTADTEVTLPSGVDYSVGNFGGNHGTLVLDVVHTIAPEAELFACRYYDFKTFTFCVDIMTTTFNVNIINHSAGVFLLPIDGRSLWADLVDRVVENSNVLWVNSVGNGHQGVISDLFAPDSENPTRHQFRIGKIGTTIAFPQVAEVGSVSPNLTRRIMLAWQSLNCDPTSSANQVIPANQINLGLRVVYTDLTGGSDESSQEQTGRPNDIAVDRLNIPLTRPFELQILDRTNKETVTGCSDSLTPAAGVEIALYVEFAGITQPSTPPSLVSPADSLNALVVGALNSSGSGVAQYSSRGNVGESGFVRPDLVAPGELTLSAVLDGESFIGTSASAAYVSGVAALVKEAFPAFSSQEMLDYFKQLAVTQLGTVNSLEAGNGSLRLPDNFPPPPPPTTPGPQAKLPFFQSFDSTQTIPDPLLGWRQPNGGAWRVEQRDAGPVLIGRGNPDRPLIISALPEPAWAAQPGPLFISFDLMLMPGAPGLRVVFRHTEETNSGYNVLEILEGLLLLKRDDVKNVSGGFSDYIADRDFETSLEGLSTASASIVPNRLHRIEMWVDGRQIFVYVDGLPVLRGLDNFTPQLQAGDIIFQALDAERDILIDNLTILRPATASNHFEGGLLSGAWTPYDFAGIDIAAATGVVSNNYLEIQDENYLSVNEPNKDFLMDCRIASFEGGFSLRVEEVSTESASPTYVEMEYRENRTRLFQMDSQGNILWERTQDDETKLRNIFSRGWDQIRLSLVGDILTLTKDGQTRFIGRIGQPMVSLRKISFETQEDDKLGIDDCLLIETTIQNGT